MTDEEMLDRTVHDLGHIDLVKKEDVIVRDVKRFKYGYPVYDLNYCKNIKIVRDYFESIDVPLYGRFAEFVYINSDECMRRAIVLAEKLNKKTGVL